MKFWIINTEDVEETVVFETLEDVEKYILDHISIREADEEWCEK